MTFFNQKIKKIENIHFCLLLFLFTYPLLPYIFVTISVILFVLFSLIFSANKAKNKIKKIENRFYYMLLFSGHFIILIISLFYSSNIEHGVNIIIKQSPILLIPICVLFFPITIPSKIILNKVWEYFVFVNVVLGFLLIGYFIYYYNLQEGFSARFFRETLRKISFLDFHPTYVSTYMGISILYLINNLLTKINYLKISALIILISVVFVLTSRIGIAALFFAIIVQFVLKVKGVKSNMFKGGLLIIIIITIFSNDFIYNRFIKVYSSGVKMPDSHNLTSTNLRTGVFYCAFSAIKENWIIGQGVGDLQLFLDNCYETNFDTTLFQRRSFNSHNHYLFLLASAGLFSLISYLVFLFWALHFLYKKKDLFLLSSFVFVFIIFLTESFLQRSYGIATYNIIILALLYKISGKDK